MSVENRLELTSAVDEKQVPSGFSPVNQLTEKANFIEQLKRGCDASDHIRITAKRRQCAPAFSVKKTYNV